MALRLKPGDSLAWGAIDDSGDITGTDIEAALARGDFYHQLDVTPVNLTAGEFTISTDSTSRFPVGRLDCDIKYSVAGVVTRTATFQIIVDKAVTK